MGDVRIPKNMEVARFEAPRMVRVDGEIPLIHPDDPDEKKVQERWIAKCKVFNLGIPAELKEYEAVWQKQCDGSAKICDNPVPAFDSAKNTFIAFMRWAEYEFIAPGTRAVG